MNQPLDLDTELPALRMIVNQIRPKLAKWKREGIKELSETLNDAPKDKWQDMEDEPQDLILYSLAKLLIARDLTRGLKRDDRETVARRLQDYVESKEAKLNKSKIELLAVAIRDGKCEGLLIDCAVPMLQTARLIQGAFSSSHPSLHKGLLVSVFYILKELFTVSPPGWSMGSARAAQGAAPTAFITGECTRARGYIARAFQLTGRTLELIRSFIQEMGALTELRLIPKEWKISEIKRISLFYHNEFSLLNRRSLFQVKLDIDVRKQPMEIFEEFAKTLKETLTKFQLEWAAHFKADLSWLKKETAASRKLIGNEIQEPRGGYCRPASKAKSIGQIEQQYQSFITNELALLQLKKDLDELNRGILELIRILKNPDFDDLEPLVDSLQTLESSFVKAANEVRTVNEPSEVYFKSILERELAHRDTPAFSLGELVFAASSLSELEPIDYQQQIAFACKVAIDRIATHGIVCRLDGPALARVGGLQVFVYGSEIIRAFTQLVANVGAEINVEVIEKLMAYFEQVAYPDPALTSQRESIPKILGWHQDSPNYPPLINRNTTALCLLAMDKVCRMIDAFVNKRILKCFRVTNPGEIKVGLDEAVYSDFGLANIGDRHTDKYAGNKEACRKSIAEILECMRSHVSGAPSAKGYESILSAVLFGPPGTGKSTLPKALAKSSRAPFVEITPGDLLAKGEPLFDNRTSSVFEAVSYLRGCVILFDEFDQIILDRVNNKKNENIFSFATGNNLTRLAELHDRFDNGRSVFILSTNRISTLDNAAIRKGRFDTKIGIYNPDFVSFAGAIGRVLTNYLSTSKLSDSAKHNAWERYINFIMDTSDRVGINLLSALSDGNLKPWIGAKTVGPSIMNYILGKDPFDGLEFLYLDKSDITPYMGSTTGSDVSTIAKSEARQVELLQEMQAYIKSNRIDVVKKLRDDKAILDAF